MQFLRPCPGRNLTDIRKVLNYRLYAGHSPLGMVECTFGVLANKCRVPIAHSDSNKTQFYG